jgi:hypothetical protein
MSFERSFRLLSLRRTLGFPLAAIGVCVFMYVVLSIAESEPEARVILYFTPIALLVCGAPMVAIGGRLHVRITPGELRVRRDRVPGLRGEELVIRYTPAVPPRVHTTQGTGRYRWQGHLWAERSGAEPIRLVGYCYHDVLVTMAREISSELARHAA